MHQENREVFHYTQPTKRYALITTYILYMVEAQWWTFAGVLQGLRGEGFVMAM